MPGTILDIFNQDAFSASALTGNINIVPNNYGRVRALGLFRDEPIPTTTVTVIVENGVLNLLPTRPRGGPPSLGTRGKQKPMAFVVPHIPHDDSVLATDVQNMLSVYGPMVQLETALDYTNRKLATMRLKHGITLEHMRVTALRGRILDSDGSVLLDLFSRFSVTEKVVDFLLGTAATDIVGLCRSVTGYMEDNLLGETMTGVHALASPEWLAKFVSHPKFVDTYKFYARAGLDPATVDTRKGFEFYEVDPTDA